MVSTFPRGGGEQSPNSWYEQKRNKSNYNKGVKSKPAEPSGYKNLAKQAEAGTATGHRQHARSCGWWLKRMQ